MPAARMLMATPEMTWSTPKVTVASGVQQPAEGAEQHPADERGRPAPLVAGPAGAPGAEDHHALEADVDDAGALGEQPAQRGQPDRHGEQQGGGHRRRRRQRLLAADRPDGRENSDERAGAAATSAAGPAAAGEQRGDRPPAGRLRCRQGRAHACTSWRASVDPPAAASGRARRPGRRPRPRPCRARRPGGHPPGDLVGDDHGEHDRALEDRHHRRREVGDLQRHQRPVEEGEQQRGQRDAAGLVAAEQRHRDAEEAEAGGEVGRVGVRAAEQVGQADQAGDRAGEQHRLDHHGAGVHAAGAGGRRRDARWPAGRTRSGCG